MTEKDTQTLPAWTPTGPSPVVILFANWKQVIGATLAAMVLAAAVSLVLPKTFRATCDLLVAPPRYTEDLKLPPQAIDMTTVLRLSQSPTLIQEVISNLSLQRDLVIALEEKLGGEEPWSAMAVMDATEVATALARPLDLPLESAWNTLPPEYLLRGYDEFEPDAFDELDPLVLSWSLTASIKTSMETNAVTEYQPVLTLAAEWGTEYTAAIVTTCWAKTIISAIRRDLIEPVTQDQKLKLYQVETTDAELQSVVEQLQELEARNLLNIRIQERESLFKSLYTGWNEVPSLLSKRDDLEREVTSTIEQLANSRRLVEDLQFEGAWIGTVGDVEAIKLEPGKSRLVDPKLLHQNQILLSRIERFSPMLRQSIADTEKAGDADWVSPFPPGEYSAMVKIMEETWDTNADLIISSTRPVIPSNPDISNVTDARSFSDLTRDTVAILQGLVARLDAFQKTLSAKKRLLESEVELYDARKANKIEQLEAELKVYTEKLDAATRSLGVLLGQPDMDSLSPEVRKRIEEIQYLEGQKAEAEDGLAAAKLLIDRLENQRQQAIDLLEDRKMYYIDQLKSLSDLADRHQKNRRDLRALERMIDLREERADYLNTTILDVQAKVAQLTLQKSTLEKMHNFLLDQVGGIEAMSSDYASVLRVNLLRAPMPPKQKVAPRRSLIVLIAGALAFFLVAGWIVLKDRYDRLRAASGV